jgi:hypothetical protein
MNHHGEIRDHYEDDATFRSSFPVRYLLLGFEYSKHSTLLGTGRGFLVDPLRGGPFHKAPESSRVKFDPYAADVYQTARALYTEIHVTYFSHPIPKYLLTLLTPAGNRPARTWAFAASSRYDLLQSISPYFSVSGIGPSTRVECKIIERPRPQ